MSRPHRLVIAPAMLFAALATTSSPVEAQTRATEAERAFHEGLALFEAGNTAQACARFSESFRVEAANGTLQNLAACHEKEGKTALAWREWRDLAKRAAEARQEGRETLARERAAALAAGLPRVRLRDPAPGSSVQEVRLDGLPLERDSWREAFVVEPGRHELVFSAPGHRSVALPFVMSDPALLELEVPALEKDAPAQRSGDAAAGRRTAGWITAGAGAVLLGAGSVFGVLALGQRSDSDDECPGGKCTARGVDLNDQALRSAWVANIGIGAGLVALGVGAYLLLTSKSDQPLAVTARGAALTF